jgi:hypothetical protein
MGAHARPVGVPLLAVLLLAGTLVLAGTGPASAGPANDAFSSAQPISGTKGVVYGTVAGATIENGSGVCNQPQRATRRATRTATAASGTAGPHRTTGRLASG